MTDRLAPLPVWLHVLAHLFYSQELLGFDHIVPVFWTLCLEFQFYLVFCLLLWPAQIVQRRLKQPFATPQSQIGKLILFAPLSLLALCWPLGLLHAKLHGLFLPTWYMFLLGAFAFWALVDRRVRIWFLFMVLILAGSYLWTRRIEGLVAATTAFAIWYAGNRDRLYRWLNYSWLQYLGGLSYSIYLLHGIIGTRALNLGNRLAPNSVGGYLFWLVVAVAGTLLSAHVLYVYVERPCVRLAQGLKVLQSKPSESLWSGLGQRIRKKPSGQNATAG